MNQDWIYEYMRHELVMSKNYMKETDPRLQSKVSSGPAAGMLEREIKVPSTYTFAEPGISTYSDTFLIVA